MSWYREIAADTVSWGLIAGVLVPWLTAVVQRPWCTKARELVAVAHSVVVGMLTCLANGDLVKAPTVLATVAAVLVASQVSYDKLWRHVGVRAVERATTPGSLRVPR